MEKTDYENLESSYFSFWDIISIGLILSVGLYFIVLSAIKLVFNLTTEPDILDSIYGIAEAVIGFGLIFSAYKYVKRTSLLKSIADELFIEAIYDRLEPLLYDIAQTRASYDILSERIDNLNFNVNYIKESIELGKNENTVVPVQYSIQKIYNLFQYTMVSVISLGLFIYLQYNVGDFMLYMIPFTYVMWWGVITHQHDLWDVEKAWIWVALPILTLPMFSILFAAIYSGAEMLGIMYFGLLFYILFYYIWAEYTSRGIIPFGIEERIHYIKSKLERDIDSIEKTKPQKKKITPMHIGYFLIIISIISFILSILGYVIDNKLFNLSWDNIGINITWVPLYSYILISLGIILLITGYVFVMKFRRFE